MDRTLKYLFIIVFLLLSFVQFKLFYHTYQLKQEELHANIQKSLQVIKMRIEQHETERHKILFEKYKTENLCGDTYANKNLDLTFSIAPTDSFSNLKDLTDIISKKLANQALQSGSFMLESLPLDTSYINQISLNELSSLDNNVNYSLRLALDTNQARSAYNYRVLLFDDYRLYHPTYLLLNIKELSKMLLSQLVLMLVICLITMFLLFIITKYAYLSILKFKKLSEEKAEFINHLAHEIKTPLSSIFISSQALRDKRIANSQETVAHYSDIIFLEAEKLHHQLDNVLSVSAADKNFLTLKMEENNLHEIILQLSEVFTKRINSQNGKLLLHLDASKSMVSIDKIHFGNVLYNLFDNAIKYSSPDNIHIVVSTFDTETGIKVEIQDSGRGISREDQDKIFTLFYKKDPHVKGFGVGLHYAKKIMQYHKGMIEVKSIVGMGTILSLNLPGNTNE